MTTAFFDRFLPETRPATSARRLCAVAVLIGLSFAGLPARAIDNPDAPDYLGEFQRQCQGFESKIQNGSDDRHTLDAYAAYQNFLESALNRAYQRLRSRIALSSRNALTLAERQWLEFLRLETSFIDGNWTAENFGSSSSLSRADYRASLTRQRVETLLQYQRNYQ